MLGCWLGGWWAILGLCCTVGARASGTETFTFAAVGDLMFNGIAIGSGVYPFHSVSPLLQGADLAFANLETPLTTRGTRTPHKSAADVRARKQYILRGSPTAAGRIRAAGIDIVSFANNHAMDWGEIGMRDTFRSLDKVRVKHVGAAGTREAAHRHAVVTVKGTRIAFLAYLAFRGGGLNACTPAGTKRAGIAVVPNSGGTLSSAGIAQLTQDIARAKADADLVFVSFHWGNERQPLPTPYQRAVGHKAVDLGANLVIGHHPHVLQPIERYKGVPILYSLGNFVAPNSAGALGDTGIAIMRWRGSQLESLEFIPARISGGSPKLLSGAQAVQAKHKFTRLCQRLSATQAIRRQR